jgi:hypothetical protein
VLLVNLTRYSSRLALGLVLLVASALASSGAQTLLTQHYIEIKQNQRTATFEVINIGDKTGQFQVDFVDKRMSAEGVVVSIVESDEQSLIPYFRISPRRFTLRPKETQVLRIRGISQRRDDAPLGEYLSHTSILVSDHDVRQTVLEEDDSNSPKMHISHDFPVVWKNFPPTQKPAVSVDIESLSAGTVQLTVTRISLSSFRGWMHWGLRGTNGKVTKLDLPATPVFVYSNLPARTFRAPIPEELLGQTTVLLFTSDREGNKPLLKPLEVIPPL